MFVLWISGSSSDNWIILEEDIGLSDQQVSLLPMCCSNNGIRSIYGCLCPSRSLKKKMCFFRGKLNINLGLLKPFFG